MAEKKTTKKTAKKTTKITAHVEVLEPIHEFTDCKVDGRTILRIPEGKMETEPARLLVDMYHKYKIGQAPVDRGIQLAWNMTADRARNEIGAFVLKYDDPDGLEG